MPLPPRTQTDTACNRSYMCVMSNDHCSCNLLYVVCTALSAVRAVRCRVVVRLVTLVSDFVLVCAGRAPTREVCQIKTVKVTVILPLKQRTGCSLRLPSRNPDAEPRCRTPMPNPGHHRRPDYVGESVPVRPRDPIHVDHDLTHFQHVVYGREAQPTCPDNPAYTHPIKVYSPSLSPRSLHHHRRPNQ